MPAPLCRAEIQRARTFQIAVVVNIVVRRVRCRAILNVLLRRRWRCRRAVNRPLRHRVQVANIKPRRGAAIRRMIVGRGRAVWIRPYFGYIVPKLIDRTFFAAAAIWSNRTHIKSNRKQAIPPPRHSPTPFAGQVRRLDWQEAIRAMCFQPRPRRSEGCPTNLSERSWYLLPERETP